MMDDEQRNCRGNMILFMLGKTQRPPAYKHPRLQKKKISDLAPTPDHAYPGQTQPMTGGQRKTTTDSASSSPGRAED